MQSSLNYINRTHLPIQHQSRKEEFTRIPEVPLMLSSSHYSQHPSVITILTSNTTDQFSPFLNFLCLLYNALVYIGLPTSPSTFPVKAFPPPCLHHSLPCTLPSSRSWESSWGSTSCSVHSYLRSNVSAFPTTKA